MPNWLDRWLRETNVPGGEPAPTPSFPSIVDSAFPEKPAIEKPPAIPADLMPDLQIQDKGYPAVVPVKPSDNQLQYKPVDRGGRVVLPQTPVSDVVLGQNYPADKPAPVTYQPISSDQGNVPTAFLSRGTTGSWADTTPLPPVTTVSQPQSTSALDMVQKANANAAAGTPMIFGDRTASGDYAPRAQLVAMPIPSQMVTPETPGAPGTEVRRAELVRLPDLIQKGLPPSEMVTPSTTPPVSQQPQPQVRKGILIAPQVQPAIPVSVGSASVTAAPKAQTVAPPSTYDLSTYTADQRAAFLDKIKNLGPNDQIPASVYESVVPLPKIQPQTQTTQTTSPYSADKINSIFGQGMLAGRGQQFIDVAKKYGLNPYALASISALETGYGTSHALAAHNNLGGLMDPKTPNATGFQHFNSIDEGLDAFASLIKRRYADRGLNTIGKMAPVYSPAGAANDPYHTNQGWGSNVSSIYRRLAS